MDDNVVEQNIMGLRCNLLLHDALGFWSSGKYGNLSQCLKEIIKIRRFEWVENGKVIDLTDDEILLKSIDCLNTTIIAQISCYVYEMATLNPSALEGNDFKNIENIIVSDDIDTDYKFLNFIRNAISHNDDNEDKLLYTFSLNNNSYTFLLNKEGCENSKVIIEKQQLMNFISKCLEKCITSKDKEESLGGKLHLIKKNIYSNYPLNDPKDFIEFYDLETKEFVDVDENQRKIIFDIVEYLRNNNVESHNCVNLCYPYKQNAYNNCLRMYDFYYLISGLYSNKDGSYNEYMKKLLYCGTYYDRADIKQKYDIPGLFLVNRLFHVFSTTKNQDLDNGFTTMEFERINKLRNSIVHGTFYKDFYGTFYFYDAPRKQKNEKQLKYIDKLTIEDFRSINWKFLLTKNIIKESNKRYVNEEERNRLIFEDIKRKFRKFYGSR